MVATLAGVSVVKVVTGSPESGRTECGKRIVGRKICLDPSMGLAMHGQCEGKRSLEDYLGSNFGGLYISP